MRTNFDTATCGRSEPPEDRVASGRRLPRRAQQLAPFAAGLVFMLAATFVSAQYTLPRVTVRLNGTLVDGGDVAGFLISPDSQRVLYSADQDTDNARELYSVPSNGGPNVRLNVALPSGSAAGPIGFTADSQRVVFIAPQETTGVHELYTVPADGPATAAIKLNGPLGPGGRVLAGQSSPDSKRVIYIAEQDAGGGFGLFSIPIEGPAGTAVRLGSDVGVLGRYGRQLDISADSRRVVYITSNTLGTARELYSVLIEGPQSARVKLNTAVAAGGEVKNFAISPDGSRVVFRGDILTEGVDELFSVPIAGPFSQSVKLSVAVPSTAQGVSAYQITPDGQRVVYTLSMTTSLGHNLYSVPIEGPAGDSIRLNPDLVAGGTVGSFRISADSRRVVYKADQDIVTRVELYSVPTVGPPSQAKKLNFSLGADGDVRDFDITPNSLRVVYLADPWSFSGVERFHLYSVPIDGPAEQSKLLNGPLQLLGDVDFFLITADGSRVIYLADQETDDVWELYEAPIAGPGSAAEKISGTLVAGGTVLPRSFGVSPDGRRVVYVADRRTDEVFELYATSLRPTAGRHWELYD